MNIKDKENIRYVLNDWLKFLKNMKDNSAIVVSFWVIDDFILKWESAKELCSEIKRVSYPFTILWWNNLLNYYSFTKEEEIFLQELPAYWIGFAPALWIFDTKN